VCVPRSPFRTNLPRMTAKFARKFGLFCATAMNPKLQFARLERIARCRKSGFCTTHRVFRRASSVRGSANPRRANDLRDAIAQFAKREARNTSKPALFFVHEHTWRGAKWARRNRGGWASMAAREIYSAKRPTKRKSMGSGVAPSVAKSASTRPSTGANLKPWPERPAANATFACTG
jgi:hypothetical protein